MGFRYTSVLIPAACLAAAGCVSPGEMDTGAIRRYQQAIAQRALQQQGGDKESDLLRPAEVCAVPRMEAEEVVERTIKTTCTYEGKIDPDGQLPRDRSKTTIVVTELDLDADTGEPDQKTARVILRSEIETTRTFSPRKGPQGSGVTVREALVKTVERRTEHVRDPKSGKLAPRAEIVTTSTYKEVPGKAGADGNEEEGHVEVKTNVKTTPVPDDPAGGAEAKPPKRIEASEVNAASRISIAEHRRLERARRSFADTRTTRAGRKLAEPAMLKRSRRLVRLALQDAIMGALATNPDIRVVSFDPAISREEMAMAAAVFDHAVFYNMNFTKEGSDDVTGLAIDRKRIQSYAAGLRQMTVTGGTWSLQSALSRTWDSTDFDGLYKHSIALEATQPLLRGAWPEFNLANLRIAKLNSKVSDAWFRAEVERIVTEVAVAYWELVQARRTMQIKQELLDMSRQAMESLKARRRIDVPMARIKQVEVAIRSRNADLVDTRQWIGEVQNRLIHLVPDAQLKGPPVCEIVPVTPPLERELQVSPGEQLMTAVRHNPLLEQARLGIAAAKINISVAENETLPILNLSAAVETQGFRRSLGWPNEAIQTDKTVLARPAVTVSEIEQRPGFPWDHLHSKYTRRVPVYSDDCLLGYRFDLLLDYPIGNRWAMARLRQAKFQHAQTIATMQQTVNNLALEISESVRRIRQAYDKIEAHRMVAEAAKAHIEALDDIEQVRGDFTAGFVRVRLRTQEDLAEAEEQIQQAVFDYNSARAELNRTTGTVLKLRRIEIALPALIRSTRPGTAATRPAERP